MARYRVVWCRRDSGIYAVPPYTKVVKSGFLNDYPFGVRKADQRPGDLWRRADSLLAS